MNAFRLVLIFSILFAPLVVFGQTPTVPFPGKSDFIRDWLVCGPFPNAPDANPIDFKHDRRCSGYFNDLLLPAGGEAAADPKEGDSFREEESNRMFHWDRIQSKEDLISFENLFKPNDLVVAYAFCHIDSASDTPAILSLGSNDGVRVFVNGEMVHDFLTGRWLGKDTDYIPIQLKKGINRLLIKVEEGTGDWGFSARLLDYHQTLRDIEANIETHKKLTVVSLDDDLVVTFGAPYKIVTLNPGARGRIDIYNKGGELLASLSGPPGIEQKFPLSGFDDGLLIVKASFPLKDGRMITSEKSYLKGKIPREALPEMLGKDLAMRRDGKPFLPIGCYGARPEDYALLKENGFNFVAAGPDALDKVAEAGLMAAVPFHGDDEAYLKELGETIEANKNHPAVLCWMLADEPEYNKLDLMGIYRAYQLVHRLDPSHPAYLVITDPRGYETFGRCCDVLAVDTYPISNGTIQDVGANIAKAYRITGKDRPVWHCGQTFRWPSDRAPTPQEHRFMSYLALLEGVKGLLWYAHRWGDYHLPTDDPALWEAQKQFIAEVHRIEPHILAEGLGQKPEVISEGGRVRAVRKQAPDGSILVISLNATRNEAAKARIAAADSKARIFEVLGENRTATLNSEGWIEDSFEPLGVHVYLAR